MGKNTLTTTSIYGKYPPSYNFKGMLTLNLGCGMAQYKFPNVVNVDKYDICNPDTVHDCDKIPYPFMEGSFDLIIANHILEHLHNWWDAFNECARILKEGGRLEIYLPGIGNDSQLGYRDHVSEINQFSFYGIYDLGRPTSNAWAEKQKELDACRMKLTSTATVMVNKWWVKYSPVFIKQWMAEHLRNVNYESQFIFRKVKKEEMQWRQILNKGK